MESYSADYLQVVQVNNRSPHSSRDDGDATTMCEYKGEGQPLHLLAVVLLWGVCDDHGTIIICRQQ